LLAHFTFASRSEGDRVSIIPILVLLLVAMWLLVIRPQRARQKAVQQTLQALAPGTEVLTAGGLYGVVRDVADDEIRVEIAPDTVVRVARRAIAAVIEEDDDQLEELERAQREAEEEVVAAHESGDR
jgi:preprotein translocase subunit YajC